MYKNKKILIGILIVVLIILIGVATVYILIEKDVTNRADFNFKTENTSSNPVNTISNDVNNNTENSTFTKTYNVLNVAGSNDENYIYLTIRQFQEEEVKTVKVQKSLVNNIEIRKDYEFTFKYTDKKAQENIESIFANATLISIKKTDKQGLEQIQDSI